MHDIEDNQIFFNTFRYIPFPVVITDIQGDIVFLNKAFEEITGYKSGDLMGKNPRILKSGEHSGAFYTDLWNKIKDGEIWTGEFYNRRKNGEFYRERAKIAPV
ncbi:MAG: PAS domain S-box protein, partial [Bacteroidota bacterium]